MIRAGYPLPPALRLRLSADAAAEGIARRFLTVRRRFVAVVRNDSDAARAFSSVRDRRDPDVMRLVEEFVARYDELVDLLCWTAKEGANDTRRSRYAGLRAWFLQNYDRVRPMVMEYLESEAQDCDPVAPGSPAPRDAFESLFLPAQIDALIHSDGVITRIVRTRNAVEACREELERACVLVG